MRREPGEHLCGGNGTVVYDCQWPGCPRLAEHRTQRGITRTTLDAAMEPMVVCTVHMLAFRELSDPEALDISARRGPARRRWIASSYVVGHVHDGG
jgi:hypothetical protein